MKRHLTIAALCLLQACQTMPNVPISAPAQPLVWKTDFPLQELALQSVETDECGLALWVRAKEAKRIFFAVNTRRQATVNFEGQTVSLAALHERTSLTRGFSPEQLYEGSDLRAVVDVDIETRSDVRESAVVRSGMLSLTQISTGKSMVVPVVGIIGCS